MIIFVYIHEKSLVNQILTIFKEFRFIILNSNIKFDNLYQSIKQQNKNFVLFNFTKERLYFEHIMSLRRTTFFFYFLPKEGICANLPEYIKEINQQKVMFCIKENYKQNIINCIKTKKRFTFNFNFIVNEKLKLISKTHKIYESEVTKIVPKLKIDGDLTSKFIYHNIGDLCILFTIEESNYLHLYFNNNEHQIYFFQNSNIIGSSLNCLQKMIASLESFVVGKVQKFNDILTFTIVNFNSNKKEHKFHDFYQFFVQTIFSIEKQQSKDSKKMPVYQSNVYYLQKYEYLHLYVPKIFSVGQKKDCDNTNYTNYKIKFDDITFL